MKWEREMRNVGVRVAVGLEGCSFKWGDHFRESLAQEVTFV